MDGAGVSHALLMPNPWIKCGGGGADRPTTWRATDDAERIAVYSYADQMVADAWAALGSEWRLRLAPVLGAVSAADGNAVGHLRRMLRKHADLWRAVVINGAVTCRPHCRCASRLIALATIRLSNNGACNHHVV